MKSESIKELSTALMAFQAECPAVKMDADNPFYKSKYATLHTIRETIKAPLAKNNLSVAQILDNESGNPVLETILMHTSGEWLSGRYPVKGLKEDPQAYGSAITYARRYALSAVLGIVTEEDDDGNATVAKKTTQKASKGNDAPKTSDPPKNAPGDVSQREHWCNEHGVAFEKKTKDGKSWYSHKREDGGYCNEKPEDPYKAVKEIAKSRGIGNYDQLKEALGVDKLEQITPEAAMQIIESMPVF